MTDEHSRSSVPATLLSVPWRPCETPRVNTERSAHTPRQVVETAEIRSMMTQQTTMLMQHMTSLMSLQEKTISRLLESTSRRPGVSFSVGMTSAADSHDFKDALNGKDGDTEHSLDSVAKATREEDERTSNSGEIQVAFLMKSTHSIPKDSAADMTSAAKSHEYSNASRDKHSDAQHSGKSAAKSLEDQDAPHKDRVQVGFVRNSSATTRELLASNQHSKKFSHDLHGRFQSIREKALTLTEDTSASSGFRAKLQHILKSTLYDCVIAAILIFNCVLIIAETDLSAQCAPELSMNQCVPTWMFTMNIVFLAIYTLESVVVIDAVRLHIFREKDRLFEVFIVIVSWVDLILIVFGNSLPSIEYLRLIRLTRLLRMTRLLSLFPELRHIMMGFANAMSAMLWGFMLLMVILLGASIIAVEIVRPVNRKVQPDSAYCAEAFESVWNATLLLFQIIPAGDSWGACMLPIIKYEPVLFLFVGGTLIAVQVGFLNLVMSVIIDRVAESRENDKVALLRKKEKEIHKSRARWMEFFARLDSDGSGFLSLDEFMQGFDEIPEFNTDLKLLGIERQDLPHLLNLMDEDSSNCVSCDELLSMFDMVWNFDTKMHQVSIGMQLRTVFHHLEQRLQAISHKIEKLAAGVNSRCL